MYKIKGEPDLVKDDSGVIQNTNQSEYRAFVAKRNAALETKQRLDKLEQDQTEIKDTLKAILGLLQDKQ